MGPRRTSSYDVYRVTTNFPREERYGLTSQVRRSAVSVTSKIAEGCCRSQGDFRRFVQIAVGSASELEYQLLLAKGLNMLGIVEFQPLAEKTTEVRRMLVALLSKLTADS